jgi:hypothetical protein
MTEQQRPDEEVEGHVRKYLEDAEGTEGAEVEGHGFRTKLEDEGSDEVEGHGFRTKLEDEGSDDDDVEGHSPARRPV